MPAWCAPLACSHRPVYIDADEYGDQGKQTTAIQVRAGGAGGEVEAWDRLQMHYIM